MISYNVLQKRLISQKYKKCSPGKYALLPYVAVWFPNYRPQESQVGKNWYTVNTIKINLHNFGII